jgi:hypothetical protein
VAGRFFNQFFYLALDTNSFPLDGLIVLLVQFDCINDFTTFELLCNTLYHELSHGIQFFLSLGVVVIIHQLQ